MVKNKKSFIATIGMLLPLLTSAMEPQGQKQQRTTRCKHIEQVMTTTIHQHLLEIYLNFGGPKAQREQRDHCLLEVKRKAAADVSRYAGVIAKTFDKEFANYYVANFSKCLANQHSNNLILSFQRFNPLSERQITELMERIRENEKLTELMQRKHEELIELRQQQIEKKFKKLLDKEIRELFQRQTPAQ